MPRLNELKKKKKNDIRQKETETSFIEKFLYPKYFTLTPKFPNREGTASAAVYKLVSFSRKRFSPYTPAVVLSTCANAAWLLRKENTSAFCVLYAPNPTYTAEIGCRSVCAAAPAQKKVRKQ